MAKNCELCENEVTEKGHVVLNEHIICYDCVCNLVDIMTAQDDEDKEKEGNKGT